jgi:hypothetical protein
MRILVENSTWNNIGDAFYQTSLYSILRQVFPQHKVHMTDGPITRAFRPNRYFQKNAFDSRLVQDADVYCFSGPILGERFLEAYGDVIKSLSGRGRRYMLLSIHGHDRGVVTREIRNFLESYPPLAFSSRDEPTFNVYSGICKQSYNGICTAFFVSKTCPISVLIPNYKYITMSVYTSPDPEIFWEVDKDNRLILDSVRIEKKNMPWWRMMRHFEWVRCSPTSKNNYVIVRPVHDIGYKFSHLNFAKANSFLSYNPLSYLSLYSSTTLTISDRVHACVVTLSYGNPAIFVGRTGRSTVFSRLGLNSDMGAVMQLSEGDLQKEYKQFCGWLRGIEIS